ncbi:Uma2 family endonuclease [Neorhodopirellula pilleata]|uniref:Putative restriction endonuclease domain-containing protein n=1 Tax=Neorhodopirellula pilleata TaxID=2714738 RepID=A0A5C5ZRV2_9BACT|nr:Uma2 family endonuclease [Neorhodopirellula pilleata]TWT89521.1 hypothetical protein Pla100_54500 [Neorhodopirellula pilleata]
MSSASDPPDFPPPFELKPLPLELWPSVEHIVTEVDAPLNNVFSQKQMRLLTESLYASWQPESPFIAFANVGLFYGVNLPPLVPNVMLCVDARPTENLLPKLRRSYFAWAYGKSPEVAIEIVSDREGKEDTDKMKIYNNFRVCYYYIFDPEHHLSDETLRGYRLLGSEYELMTDPASTTETIGLGLTLWNGRYEDTDGLWLRWVDPNGELIATGFESAQQQNQRAEEEARRVNEMMIENKRLVKLLNQHGIDPHDLVT